MSPRMFVLCQSECVFKELKKQDENAAAEADDCVECVCDTHGMTCCDLIPSETEVEIREGCEMVVDKKNCSFKIVMKSDKAQACDPN
uniref:Uncharacterized protein n=1 Tax=Cynoglossus semilaevis TaxID=244447 RepID=A0A3P8VJ25_CYNSE